MRSSKNSHLILSPFGEIRMRRFKKIIFRTSFVLLLIITLFSSCKKENRCDCLKRTGRIITETRDLTGFDRLYVEDNLKIFLTQDANFSVKVEAGENIVPLIKTEVDGGTLNIRNDNRCNWTRSYDKPLNVYISMPEIIYIKQNGTGKITGLNPITTDSIDIHVSNSGDVELILNNRKTISRIHGSGDLTLNGVTQQHYCDIGGTGYLQCADLNTSYSFLHSYTLGMCYVKCSNRLDCIIDYKGDIYCYGNPVSVSKTINNTGQLYLE